MDAERAEAGECVVRKRQSLAFDCEGESRSKAQNEAFEILEGGKHGQELGDLYWDCAWYHLLVRCLGDRDVRAHP